MAQQALTRADGRCLDHMQRGVPRDQPPHERQQERGQGMRLVGILGEREVHEQVLQQERTGPGHVLRGRHVWHLGHLELRVALEPQALAGVQPRREEQLASPTEDRRGDDRVDLRKAPRRQGDDVTGEVFRWGGGAVHALLVHGHEVRVPGQQREHARVGDLRQKRRHVLLDAEGHHAAGPPEQQRRVVLLGGGRRGAGGEAVSIRVHERGPGVGEHVPDLAAVDLDDRQFPGRAGFL